MRCRSLFFLFFVAVSLGVAQVAQAAFECSLMPKDGTVVVDDHGRPIALPNTDGTQCEGVRVQKGTVTACTRDRRGRAWCKTFKEGQKITSASLPTTQRDGGPLVEILRMLEGSTDQVPAVSRGEADSAPMDSLPVGPVVLLDNVLTPNFTTASLRGVESIEILREHHAGTVVAVLSPQGRPSLDVSTLQAGQTYVWRIDSGPGGLPRFGQFTLESAARRQAARTENERLQRSWPADSDARAVALAEWLQRHGCTWDAAQVLRRAGFVPPG